MPSTRIACAAYARYVCNSQVLVYFDIVFAAISATFLAIVDESNSWILEFHKVVQNILQMRSKYLQYIHREFSYESSGARILKIGLHLPKLLKSNLLDVYRGTQATFETHQNKPPSIHFLLLKHYSFKKSAFHFVLLGEGYPTTFQLSPLASIAYES